MNMSGVDPNEIYKWFMEMFVDSSDWVMIPNVYGIGTFADGGIFQQNHICGSSYILECQIIKKAIGVMLLMGYIGVLLIKINYSSVKIQD